MKISEINSYPIEIPFTKLEDGGIGPYKLGHTSLESARSLVLEVKTEEGISGWGEVGLFFSPETMDRIVKNELEPKIRGEDPFEIRRIKKKLSLDISVQFFNLLAFVSGIEVACWDIVGKVLKRPMSDLMGGKVRETLPVSYCIGIWGTEETAERTKDIMEEGYGTLKTKVGRDMSFDVERVKAIREEAGPEINIRVDPNQAYTVAEALEFLRKTKEFNLQYIEQPIRVNHFDGLASLRNRTQTPIAINEDCYFEYNLNQAIRQECIDAAVVDYEPIGGMIKLMEIGGLADSADLPLAHHCCFDLGVKTAAILQATSNISSFSYAMDSIYFSLEDYILKDPLSIENGSFELPKGPGLGIKVDRSKLERYEVSN